MRNLIQNQIIVDPSPELVPRISISPFNYNIHSNRVDEGPGNYLLKEGYSLCVEKKAREAISDCMVDMGLQSEDLVTILTTSGNYYVSGCVTKEIEKHCRWNRRISKKTKAILVIHEFGYAYRNLIDLKQYNVPIIEDCAHSLFTKDAQMGTIGDYVIYSLPKAYNIQMGALLYSKNKIVGRATELEQQWILSRLAVEHANYEDIINNRLKNYEYLMSALHGLGIEPFFDLNEKTVPSVFLFRWDQSLNYQGFKDFMQANGVECSVFYGKNAFFIPCHQNLSKADMDYMVQLIEFYYSKEVICV